jgi:hypothetical protein
MTSSWLPWNRTGPAKLYCPQYRSLYCLLSIGGLVILEAYFYNTPMVLASAICLSYRLTHVYVLRPAQLSFSVYLVLPSHCIQYPSIYSCTFKVRVGFDVVLSMDKVMNKEYFWKASPVLPFAFYRAAHPEISTLALFRHQRQSRNGVWDALTLGFHDPGRPLWLDSIFVGYYIEASPFVTRAPTSVMEHVIQIALG